MHLTKQSNKHCHTYMRTGGSLRSFLSFFTENGSCCVFWIIEANLKRSQQTKKVNFTLSAFSPSTPHRHFSSKMAVRLPPSQGRSQWSNTGSHQNPGAGGHSDHPSGRPYGLRLTWDGIPGGRWHNTVTQMNGKTKWWRRAIIPVSFHRRRRSCAPTHHDEISSDGPRLSFGQRRATILICFRR